MGVIERGDSTGEFKIKPRKTAIGIMGDHRHLDLAVPNNDIGVVIERFSQMRNRAGKEYARGVALELVVASQGAIVQMPLGGGCKFALDGRMVELFVAEAAHKDNVRQKQFDPGTGAEVEVALGPDLVTDRSRCLRSR